MIPNANHAAVTERTPGKQAALALRLSEAATNLSRAQQRTWILSRLNPDFPAYVFAGYELQGSLDIAVLQRSFAEVTARHDLLHSKFVEVMNAPVRVASMTSGMALTFAEVPKLGEIPLQEMMRRLALRVLHEPLDPTAGPLVRVHVVKLRDQSHLILIKMHELVADECSADIFMKEALDAYQALAAGGASPMAPARHSFRDFINREREWLRSEEHRRQLTYWRERLLGIRPLQLWTDRPRPEIKTHRCDSVAAWLAAPLSNRLDILAARLGTDLQTAVVAAFGVLLGRYTRQSELTIGIKVDHRAAAFDRLIGPIANVLTLRAELQNDPPFSEVLRRIDAAQREARRFADAPFDTIVEAAVPQRDLSRSPLFQVACAFNDVRRELYSVPGVRACARELPVGVTQVDLALAVTATPQGLHVRLDFSADLYETSIVKSMLDCFSVLLTAACDAPETAVSRLPLIREEERALVTKMWNETERSYPADRCLHELIELQVKRTPKAIAVSCDGSDIDYATLNERANQLAHYLRREGLRREDKVAICLERSIEIVVAMLGVLKAGGAYVPLDPDHPKERLLGAVDDSDAWILITQQYLVFRIPVSIRSVLIDTQWPAIAEFPRHDPATVTTPDNLAYLIYTSGSTGAPKAVMLNHRGIVNNITWRNAAWPLGSQDCVLQNHSFCFDPSVWATFWPLIAGARTVIVPREQQYDGRALVRLIDKHEITVYGAVPSLHALLLEESGFANCKRLRYVLSGGEPLSAKLQESLHRATAADLFNLYGPTESTIDVTSWHARSDSVVAHAPIGRPIANMRAYVLDQHLQPVPAGVPGELFISGIGLARGYHRRPVLTAARFLPDTFSRTPGARMYRTGDLAVRRADGEIVFLGRVDDQVKINGYRVELGELQAALNQLPEVQESAVVARERASGEMQLVAYVAGAGATPPQAASLMCLLETRLPAYMIPSVIVVVERLPRTPNGKVDRNALPTPSATRADRENYVEPRTPLETEIAGAFAQALDIGKLGVHDDFFELGGTSLILARLASGLASRFQLSIPIHQFFRVPTVAGVAEVVQTYQTLGLEAVLVKQHATRLEADAVLDADIRPDGLVSANYSDPSAVLLTGATGYLGAFLLERLLRRRAVDVYCLVRASDRARALERIRSTMMLYRIWDEAFARRIKPLVGDLAQPHLGLVQAEWDSLAVELDAIYHAGALVNFVYPYSALRAANVQGTKELLRLACVQRLKAFHYISTIDVLLATHAPRPFLEDDAPLRDPVEVPGGYTGSKWVAEKIANAARLRGIPVCIYRPGLVLGHSVSGATQTNDYLLVAFRGYLSMGVVPEYPRIFDTITVDYAADAIVHISTQPDSIGRFFHLFNPAPVSIHQFCEWIRGYGYKFDFVPFDHARRLALEVDAEHPLYPLVPLIRDAEVEPPASLDPKIIGQLEPDRECHNTLNSLRGGCISCPPMSEDLAHRCLAYLVEIGFLPSPHEASAADGGRFGAQARTYRSAVQASGSEMA